MLNKDRTPQYTGPSFLRLFLPTTSSSSVLVLVVSVAVGNLPGLCASVDWSSSDPMWSSAVGNWSMWRRSLARATTILAARSLVSPSFFPTSSVLINLSMPSLEQCSQRSPPPPPTSSSCFLLPADPTNVSSIRTASRWSSTSSEPTNPSAKVPKFLPRGKAPCEAHIFLVSLRYLQTNLEPHLPNPHCWHTANTRGGPDERNMSHVKKRELCTRARE